MAKKNKGGAGQDSAQPDTALVSPSSKPSMASSTPAPMSSATSSSSANGGAELAGAAKKSKPPKAPPAVQPSSSALIICRNKHWRYISSFHGPWLQLPPEILESLATANYNTPRPRPIDPAVFFDLVKIRRLVDEATNLAVRAASGVASSALSNISSVPHHAASMLGFGQGGAGQAKLSRERKFRMREQATQKLARAYRLDEIACSVATMQGASTLEDVANHVLQRYANDNDATYVQFFHEKIPSRRLAESTSLEPLNGIVAGGTDNGEALRTRATVRIFKDDLEGAAMDFTAALQTHRYHQHKKPEAKEAELVPQYNGRKQEDILLKEEEQPSSLETQLLFQRAGVYLSIACKHVANSLSAAIESPKHAPEGPNGASCDTKSHDSLQEPDTKQLEARKTVRLNAKRALRDYNQYLSHFEYSPDLPLDIADEFARKVNYASHGVRAPRPHPHAQRTGSPELGCASEKTLHRVYKLSDLFASAPPAGLPSYPSTEPAATSAESPNFTRTTTETLTYHPLLTDALHALLLCHCLIQTSPKELLRHAHMVARLVRLADGYPIFQASRSPARADWVDVIRRGANWIQLASTWDTLCAPAPLPASQSHGAEAPQAALSATASPSPQDEIADLAVQPATSPLAEDPSYGAAVRARQNMAQHNHHVESAVARIDARFSKLDTSARPKEPASSVDPLTPRPKPAVSPATNGTSPHNNISNATTGSNGTSDVPTNEAPPAPTKEKATAVPRRPAALARAPSRWSEDSHEHLILTDRAAAVARWVCEAPDKAGLAGGEGKKRKKRPAKKAAAGGSVAP